jgi:PAS domain S-box-containing protein
MKTNIAPLKRTENIFILRVILFTVLFIVFVSYLVISNEEKSSVEAYKELMRNLNKHYTGDFRSHFNMLKTHGSSANSVVSEVISSGSAFPSGSIVFRRGRDGAVRISDGFSAIFLSSKNKLNNRTRNLARKTGDLWKRIVPIITTNFLNFYLITRDNFIRIYPPRWSLEIEADHDFSGDIFYSVGTPHTNPERKAVWTPVYYDSIWEKWMTSLIVPLYSSRGEFIGITGSDYILNDLFKRVESINRFKKWCSGFIFNSDGKMIAHKDYMIDILNRQVKMNESLPATELHDLQLKEFIGGIVNGDIEPGEIFALETRDNVKYFTAMTIGNPGWYLALSTDRRKITGSFRSLRIKIITIMGLFGIVLIVIFWGFIHKMIFRRITRLNEAVEAFTHRKTDVPVKVVKNDEIGILEKGFSYMRDVVNEKIENLTGEIQRRKRAEKEYKNSQEKFKNIFHSGHDAIFIFDLEGKILDVNKTMLKMFGVTRDEALKGDIRSFSSPENRFEKLDELWGSVLESNSRELEWIAIRPNDRSTFHVQMNFKKIIYEERDAVCGTVRDITERKEAEKKADEDREKFAITLRSIGDGVIATDVHERVEFLNYVSEELTGWSSEEAVGRPVSGIFHLIDEKTRVKIETPVTRVIRTGKMVLLTENVILKAKNGSEHNIADSAAPIIDSEGNMKGVVLVFRDVTGRIKSEKELLKITKLESLGLLAGGIAHDFNNLLAGLFGNISLAKKRIDPESKAYKNLESAEKIYRRASDLTKQLLAFSKGGEPVKEIADITKIIEESTMFAIRGSSIQVERDFPEDLMRAEVDSGQISQVISNLVINAKQAMPDGGRIWISANNFDNSDMKMPVLERISYIRISVRDEGIGIPRKYLDKIFDPYFTTKQDGSGLGLATAFSIINKHNGLITVNSEPGESATFTFYIPASTKSRVDEVTGDEKLESLPALNARVLVMDDDPVILNMIEDMLEEIGCFSCCVDDGAKAIEEYNKSYNEGKQYDIVFLDLTVQGGMGGEEAVKRLKHDYPEARCIVSSGYSTDPVISNFRDYGFSGHVTKPYLIRELYNEISRVLGNREGEEDNGL